MIVKQLDSITESSGATCHLCSTNLLELINSYQTDPFSPPNNGSTLTKLDLVNTMLEVVLDSKSLPPFVLFCDQAVKWPTKTSTIDSFKVLNDAKFLEALCSIKNSYDFVVTKVKRDPDFFQMEKSIMLGRKYADEISQHGGQASIIRKLLRIQEGKEIGFLYDLLHNNKQWVQVWSGTSASELYSKKLALMDEGVGAMYGINTLFRTVAPELSGRYPEEVEILDDLNTSSISYRNERKVGQFYAPHVSSALYSLALGAPALVSHAKSLKQGVLLNKLPMKFDFDKITLTLSALCELDKHLSENYGEEGVRWLSSEDTVSGVMAGIGRYCDKHNVEPSDAVTLFIELLKEGVDLSLSDYHKYTKEITSPYCGGRENNRIAVTTVFYNLLDKKWSHVDWFGMLTFVKNTP